MISFCNLPHLMASDLISSHMISSFMSEDTVRTWARTLSCSLEWGHSVCTGVRTCWAHLRTLCVHLSRDTLCAWEQGRLCVHLSEDTWCALEQGHFVVCTWARTLGVHWSKGVLCTLKRGQFVCTWARTLWVHLSQDTFACTGGRTPLCALEQGCLCVHQREETLCALERGHLLSTWARTLGVHLSKDTLCRLEWGHFVCTGARAFCVHLNKDNVCALELFRERRQHRVWALTLESRVKHDWAWSPHGWMTIMYLVLHLPLDSSVAKFRADSVWNMMHLWLSLCTLYLFAFHQVSYCKQLRSLLCCLCDANEVLCLLNLCRLCKSPSDETINQGSMCVYRRKKITYSH